MKRLATMFLLAAFLMPFATSQANADPLNGDVARATGVMTASKGWTVTLTIPGVFMRAGSTMPATLTIVNKTGHSLRVSGCPRTGTFSMGIGNSEAPYSPVDGAVYCSTSLHPGSNVFHGRIKATYMSCPGASKMKCGPSLPDLPIGVYHTAVQWPVGAPMIAKPGSLTIWVTTSLKMGTIVGTVRACPPDPYWGDVSPSPATVTLLRRGAIYESKTVPLLKKDHWIGEFSFDVSPGTYQVRFGYGLAEKHQVVPSRQGIFPTVTVTAGATVNASFAPTGCAL